MGQARIPLVWHWTDMDGKMKDDSNVKIKIVSVNEMEKGIVVNFEDGVCAFFEAEFLYAQVDKRVKADFGDPSSSPSGAGW
jgi:hypothetical protein